MPSNYELHPGRLGSLGIRDPKTSDAEIPVAIRDATDEDDALAKAVALVPSQYSGLVQSDANVVERVNQSTYIVTVSYIHPDVAPQDLSVGEYRVSFDTSGGSSRVYYAPGSEADVQKYKAAGFTEIEFGTAINVNEGRVEGVDQVIPSLRMMITKRVAGGFLTDAYIRTLASLTGSLNDGTYFGYQPKELLFIGASGGQTLISGTGTGDPEVVYNFLVDFGGANEKLDGVDITSRPPHSVTWVHYEPEDFKDGGGKVLYTRPVTKQVNVLEIYPAKDFSALGI